MDLQKSAQLAAFIHDLTLPGRVSQNFQTHPEETRAGQKVWDIRQLDQPPFKGKCRQRRLRRAFRGRFHPDMRPDTETASAQSGSAETSASPSRAPVSFQKTSALSGPRPCSKPKPEPRQVRGPDATRAAQRFLALEGLRPYIILSAPLETASRPPWLLVSRVRRLRPWRSLPGKRGW